MDNCSVPRNTNAKNDSKTRIICWCCCIIKEQIGPFPDTISLLETGIFDKYGISEIGIAGHPEGSPDIPDLEIKKALLLKNKFYLYKIWHFHF